MGQSQLCLWLKDEFPAVAAYTAAAILGSLQAICHWERSGGWAVSRVASLLTDGETHLAHVRRTYAAVFFQF